MIGECISELLSVRTPTHELKPNNTSFICYVITLISNLQFKTQIFTRSKLRNLIAKNHENLDL